MSVHYARRVLTQAEPGVIDNGAVVVDDDRIAWVGARADLPESYDEHSVVDHGSKTILPGLIDVHVHLGFDGGTAPVARMKAESDAEQLVLMLKSARELLSAGVTTARDLGARSYLDLVVRDAIARHDASGPRIVASGSPLTPTGGHCWFMGGEADTGTELRRAVRKHRERGVDSIKIMSTGGFMTAGSAPWFAQYTDEDLKGAVDDAHRLGMKVAAHAHGIEGIRRAVFAGVDTLEHCSFVKGDGSFEFDAALADEIVAAGIFVDFTVNTSFLRLQDSPITEHFRVIVGEMRDRGARIVAGTDAGIDNAPHFAYAAGLEGLHRFGLTTAEVIEAATTRAAEALGLQHITGSLVPGLSADFIVVDGDPLENLRVLRHIDLVVTRGREVRPDSLPEIDESPLAASLAPGHSSD